MSVDLKGSIDIVIEFLHYGINSILYQRGLYPSDTFIQREMYGLPLLVTTHPELKRYLDVILNQMRKFLERKNVHKIVIVILKHDTKEPVERWQFNVDIEHQQHQRQPVEEETLIQYSDELKRKNLKEIQESIRGVIRQITASVTFLPTLEGSHTFDILLYTDKNVELPNREWNDTSAKLIHNGEHVEFRSFSTNVHRVEPIVSYVTHEN